MINDQFKSPRESRKGDRLSLRQNWDELEWCALLAGRRTNRRWAQREVGSRALWTEASLGYVVIPCLKSYRGGGEETEGDWDLIERSGWNRADYGIKRVLYSSLAFVSLDKNWAATQLRAQGLFTLWSLCICAGCQPSFILCKIQIYELTGREYQLLTERVLI